MIRRASGHTILGVGQVGSNMPFLLSRIPEPGRTLLLGEFSHYKNTMPNPSASVLDNAIQVTNLHTGGANYLFVDGHVKWYKPEDTVGTGTLESSLGMWTRAPGD